MRKFTHLSLLLLLLAPSLLQAQWTGWSYRNPITLTDTSGVARSNYQVRLSFDSQALIAASKLQSNGGDLRFSDFCMAEDYPYWIESGINTPNTVVWVLLDTFPANGARDIFMIYGNPAAPNADNFAATFPNAIRTNGGNLTLTGALTPDYFWVEALDTVTLTAGASLVLSNTRMFRVDATGYINGDGRGGQGVSTNYQIGAGPGGGTPSSASNSGSGGGSYGGVGGTGGFDSGDTPGVGGATYGTAAGTDCQIGSAGGSGGAGGFSGSGGGALDVTADYVMVDGVITMGGTIGGNAGQCGGGGSGGCIKLLCQQASGTGTLRANGGNGGPGTSSANDSGGGGGGGRVKTFSLGTWPAMTMTANGGTGGPNGGAGPGQPGGAGSVSSVQQAYSPALLMSMSNGEEPVPSSASISITAPAASVCVGGALTLTASSGFTLYAWSTGDSTSSVTVSTGGTYIVQASADSSWFCILTDTIVIGSVTPATIAISGLDTICPGACTPLSATAGFLSYTWSNADTSLSTTVCAGGLYTVTGIDSNQCASTDSFSVGQFPSAGLVVQPASACQGDTVVLDATANAVAWSWSTNATTPMIMVNQSGSYGVTVTTAEGCQDSGLFVVTVNPNPVPVAQASGANLSLTSAFASYQWLLNGQPIAGATNATYTALTTGSYTVTVIDANGCSGTSAPVSVTVGLMDGLPVRMLVLPNPASADAVLQLSADASLDLQLRVVDALGRVVWSHSTSVDAGERRIALPAADLASGVYTVQLHDGHRQASLKFVKQ